MFWKPVVVALAIMAAACQSPTAPSAQLLLEGGTAPLAVTAGPPPGTTGGGVYRFANTSDVRFNFNAIGTGRGGATGQLFQSFVFGGELIEFRGRVTCFSVDSATGRAWIGGVVTENNSTHPQFTTPRTQPGRDIWFRVLDGGEGANAAEPDRSTISGFEGDRGIITSAEYCAAKLWPDGNVATHPVTEGNIQVRP
ncbi:MAG TPA: hypothetical protein VMO26_26860 [Vicinamibacterales bacterium]|nr:hypothetical protein [Vicinamibacterales bacterium]